MMRCFIAVDIPDELKPRVAELQKCISGYDVSIVPQESLHFTLKFLGEIDDTKPIIKSLRKLKEKAFDINIKGTGLFPSEDFIRVVWLGVENETGLINLQKSVEKALGSGSEQFKPHLTIARVGAQKYKNDISDFAKKHVHDEIGSMRVETIKLKKSTLTRNGPVYTDLETFEMIK